MVTLRSTLTPLAAMAKSTASGGLTDSLPDSVLQKIGMLTLGRTGSLVWTSKAAMGEPLLGSATSALRSTLTISDFCGASLNGPVLSIAMVLSAGLGSAASSILVISRSARPSLKILKLRLALSPSLRLP